ncbi:hypothetical protein KZ820_20630 [Sphingomonas sp. RRHST34]|uniref:TonB-dependent receptor plug domain-containing protein n=1 Tax=Sphingomonas citri TaxID=2862499 RepID=A0ABS7BUJ2_9SPHN|nr:TonB-dependent receptor plug domain-containing protein [Sphingomonas citri]MBW6533157.1 hypothetical protein [Sphingomonas citri]
MIGRHPLASTSLTVIAALWLGSPAMAQTAPADDTQTPSWSGTDIVVTGTRDSYGVPGTSAATRTDTPLIQVPQSVQVLTRTLIQEQDRRTLGDALVNVSGVTPTRSDEVLFIPPIGDEAPRPSEDSRCSTH